MISALFIHGVPVECINQAAVTYYVPAKVIVSVIETEGGWNGLAKPNKNGTVDYGVMQINSTWVSRLSHYGYTKEDVQYNGCKNVAIGTWILSREIASGGGYWHGIGNYHSHTFQYNKDYQQKVYLYYNKLNRALSHV